MKNSTHYIKTSFRHDDYHQIDILERAATLTKLSQSELIRNACLGHIRSHVGRQLMFRKGDNTDLVLMQIILSGIEWWTYSDSS